MLVLDHNGIILRRLAFKTHIPAPPALLERLKAAPIDTTILVVVTIAGTNFLAFLIPFL